MIELSETCELRLSSTSGPFRDHLIIRGVPLIEGTSYRASAKRVITVRAKLDQLAIQPAPGQHWRIKGVAVEKQALYGDFHIQELYFNKPEHLECILPDDGEGFIRFLAKEPSFTGIGEVKARKLWETFGKNIFTLLDFEDTAEIQKIIGEKSALSLLDGYEKYANLQYTSLLKELGVPLPIQMRLMKYHGPQSVARIQKNPYTLTYFGMSFREADELAHRIYSIKENEPRRVGAATEESLRIEMRKGNTAAKAEDLKFSLKKLLEKEHLVHAALTDQSSKAFVIKSGYYMSTKAYILAQVISKRLHTLSAKKPEWLPVDDEALEHAQKDLPYTLTKAQKEAVKSSLQNKISCICGGAGTGKTTVLRTVMNAYKFLGYDIFALALSGRASMRLHESTGFFTRTIASFLDKRTPEPDPQKNTVLVIDEASMLDSLTFYQLVCELVPDKHRIILVGDEAQLPPIGPGAILRDILRCGNIPAVHLDIVQRSCASTGIPEYSQCIRSKQIPPHFSMGNVKFHQVNQDQIEETCARLYSKAPQSSRIVAYTRRTVNAINKFCQRKFNSKGKVLKYEGFEDTFLTELRLGDPVLISRNDINLGVQNGTLATLTSIESQGDSIGELLLDTGKKINITLGLLDDLSLGYSVTLHKAQGSQFPIVIVVIEDVGTLLDNSWIYTAITRAELSVHLVGDKQIFTDAITRTCSQDHRKTALSYFL